MIGSGNFQPSPSASQVLASFTDYASLRRALNAVRDHRNISLELLNEITGAPSGYFQKLLGPRPARRFGLLSFDWALGGLGIKCLIVDDQEALAKIQDRFAPRDAAHLASVQGGVLHVPLKRAFLRKIGAKGGVNRWQNVSAKERSRLARKAAKIRNSKQPSKESRSLAQRQERDGRSAKASNTKHVTKPHHLAWLKVHHVETGD